MFYVLIKAYCILLFLFRPIIILKLSLQHKVSQTIKTLVNVLQGFQTLEEKSRRRKGIRRLR